MALVNPRRGESVFNADGTLALRFVEYIESNTSTTNETNENVVILNSDGRAQSMPAQLQQVMKELAGLPEFTMDTTGFTMDSTEFTMDKVIA